MQCNVDVCGTAVLLYYIVMVLRVHTFHETKQKKLTIYFLISLLDLSPNARESSAGYSNAPNTCSQSPNPPSPTSLSPPPTNPVSNATSPVPRSASSSSSHPGTSRTSSPSTLSYPLSSPGTLCCLNRARRRRLRRNGSRRRLGWRGCRRG